MAMSDNNVHPIRSEEAMRSALEALGSSQAGYEKRSLKSGGGDGTFEGMEVVDAKIAAAEARTDTKFAEVLGELKAMRAEMTHMPSNRSMIGTMGALSAVVLATVLAVLALAGDRFDGGVAYGIGSADAKLGLDRVIAENSAQTKQIEMLSNQMNQVLQAISREPQKQSGEPMPQFLPVPAN